MSAMQIAGALFIAFGLYLFTRRDRTKQDRIDGAWLIFIGLVLSASCKGY